MLSMVHSTTKPLDVNTKLSNGDSSDPRFALDPTYFNKPQMTSGMGYTYILPTNRR
jgi:hypothetical protein